MGHSTAGARLTNMNFRLLVIVFSSSSFVQADVFNNQVIEYSAKSHELDPEMVEEIFPEEYIKAHLGLKSDDQVRDEEVRHDEVSGGGTTSDRGVHTWIGVFLPLLFTLLL